MTFAVLGEEKTGGVEMRVIANAREDIENVPTNGTRVTHAVRREKREIVLTRQIYEKSIETIFAAAMVPLEFHVNIFAAECLNQSCETFVGGDILTSGERASERSFLVARQR